MNKNFKFLQKQINNLCFLYMQTMNYECIKNENIAHRLKKYIESKIWILDQEIIWIPLIEEWKIDSVFYKYYRNIYFWSSMNNNILKKFLSNKIMHSLRYSINSPRIGIDKNNKDFSSLYNEDFREYKNLDFSKHIWIYDNIYAYLMLYNFKKEQLLSFLEKNLLLFLMLKIMLDLVSKEIILSEKNNYYMLFWNKILFKQCQNIIWTIYEDLEIRIWKEKVHYCYNSMLSSLESYYSHYNIWLSTACKSFSKSIIHESNKHSEELQRFKEKIIQKQIFYFFCTYVDKIEKLKMINAIHVKDFQKELEKEFNKNYKLYFEHSSISSKKQYNGQIKHFFEIYWFSYLIRFQKTPFDTLSFQYHEYKRAKEEISKYFKNMIEIFEWWTKWSFVEKILEEYFDEELFYQNLENHNSLINFASKDIFKSLLIDFSDLKSCNKVNQRQVYLDALNIVSETSFCNVNFWMFSTLEKDIFRYLWIQYYFTALFEYMLDDKNKDSYFYRMFSCYIKHQLHWCTKEIQDNFFQQVIVKCDILIVYLEQQYYNLFIDKEDKDNMLEIFNEVKNNCMILTNQLNQLIQKYS